METVIEPHNQKPAAVWNSGGERYDDISRGIADSIEPCVVRLNPQPGERVLDLAISMELGICVPREYWVTVGVRR